MHNRTYYLLQAVMAFCVWALVALIYWQQLFELRDAIVSQGFEVIETSTLAIAAFIVGLEVMLLGFAIHRVHQCLQAPKSARGE